MTKKQCPAKTVFLGVNVGGISVFKTNDKVSAWGDRDPPAVRFLTLLLRRPGKRCPNHRDGMQVD